MSQNGHAANVYDLAIVGGGIVGLATAREFLKRQPALKLIVLEKEDILAQHQTGHNSGVLHAGIYYAPGSLKAKACVEGRSEAVEFCKERGIKFELCGKLIVALDDGEVPRLMNLWERANTNGVQGIELVGPERMREIEPYVAGVKAIWSPNTGIVDWGEVARAYADDVREWGGEIKMGAKVVALRNLSDETVIGVKAKNGAETEVHARFVVTCGGLYSDRLAEMTEGKSEVKIVPFRGDYYQIRPEAAHMCRGMIYPVPDPTFPFLGVHLTKHVDGTVWAGPNAVLAFGREGYGRWQVNLPELIETLTYPGFWKLALKYWKVGMMEMYRDYVKAAYLKELQKYTPAITYDDLIGGKSGVRAQALQDDGKMVDDFLIRHGNRVAHVQNAPSPAATSSLVIARMIVDEVEKKASLAHAPRINAPVLN
jgi:L-2-hydroxyglutarate oxidase LhgO